MANRKKRNARQADRRRGYMDLLRTMKDEAAYGPEELKVGTLNCGTLNYDDRGNEVRSLVAELRRHKCRIIFIQEARLTSMSNFKELGNYRIFTQGIQSQAHASKGAAILIDKELLRSHKMTVREIRGKGNWITALDMERRQLRPKEEKKDIRLISLYTPQEGNKSEAAWEALDKAIHDTRPDQTRKDLIIGTDLNGTVGKDATLSYPQIGKTPLESGISKNASEFLQRIPDEAKVTSTWTPGGREDKGTSVRGMKEIDYIATNLPFSGHQVKDIKSKKRMTHRLVMTTIRLKQPNKAKGKREDEGGIKVARYNRVGMKKQKELFARYDNEQHQIKRILNITNPKFQPEPEVQEQLKKDLEKAEERQEKNCAQLIQYRKDLEALDSMRRVMPLEVEWFKEEHRKMLEKRFPSTWCKHIKWRTFDESKQSIRARENVEAEERGLRRLIEKGTKIRGTRTIQAWANRPMWMKRANYKASAENRLSIYYTKERIKNKKRELEARLEKDEIESWEKRGEKLAAIRCPNRARQMTWDLVKVIRKRKAKYHERKLQNAQKGPMIKEGVNGAPDRKLHTDEEKARLFEEEVRIKFVEDNQGYKADNGLWELAQEIPIGDLPNRADQNRKLISKETRRELMEEMTVEDVEKAIEMSHENRAPGPDGIHIEVFKADKTAWARILLDFFLTRDCMKTIQKGKIVWLYKQKGSRYYKKYYRPVTLLDSMYRIWSIVINNKLKNVVLEIMENSQCGFRPQHSCNADIEVTNNVVDRAQEPELAVGCVDQSSAFDKMIRELCFEMLLRLGLPKKFVEQVRAGHLNTEVQTGVGEFLGKFIPIDKGCFQGSSLSPTLFIIYTSELNRRFKEECTARGYDLITLSNQRRQNWLPIANIQINKATQSILIVSYADDTTIFAKNLEELSEMILLYKTLAGEYGLSINAEKTEVLCRQKPTEEQKEAALEVLGTPEKDKERLKAEMFRANARLLGNYANVNGFWSTAITHRMNIATDTWNKLQYAFFRSPTIAIELKNTVFRGLMVSTLFYALETKPLTPNEIKDLQTWMGGRLNEYARIGLERNAVDETGYKRLTHKEVIKRTNMPSAKSLHAHRRICHIVREIANNTIAGETMCHEMENETQPAPKQGIKGQAKRPLEGDLVIMAAVQRRMIEFAQKREELRLETLNTEKIALTWEEETERLQESGFPEALKIIKALWKHKVSISTTNPFQLEELVELHREFGPKKGMELVRETTRAVLDTDYKNTDYREKIHECKGCGNRYASQLSLAQHLGRGWDTACAKGENPVCLEAYQQEWDMENAANAAIEPEECPWGILSCTFPDATGGKTTLAGTHTSSMFCIACRYCSGREEGHRAKWEENWNKKNDRIKDIKLAAKKKYMPHKRTVAEEETCPHKVKTCSFPDREKNFWCARCCKACGFWPPTSAARRDARERKRREDQPGMTDSESSET